MASPHSLTSTAEFQGDYIPRGFQTKRARRPRKEVPMWANSDSALKKRILGRALRRYWIAYLYWRVGLTAREVAEELGIKISAVKSVIYKLEGLPRESLRTLYRG
jgi:hypothetical protein